MSLCYDSHNQFEGTGYRSPSNLVIPTIIERENALERSYDIYSLLMKHRIINVEGEVNSQMASIVSTSLLLLDKDSKIEPIMLLVDSPGGSVDAGLRIIDTMKMINAPVYTCVTGIAMSMGSAIATSGEPGKRFMMPHARNMMHQPSSGTQGKSTDMKIYMQELERIKEKLYMLYVNSIGKSYDEVVELCDNGDRYFSAEEAVEMKLADHIIHSINDFENH